MEDEAFDFSVMSPTGGFVVEGMEESPLAGASLFDSAAESIRAARLGPMAAQAGGAYNRQAGALGSMVDRLSSRRDASVSALDKAYREAQPSGSEKWLSVAAALLSPTESGNTSESIAKALGVFGQYAGEKRKFAQAKASDLATLASRYDIAEGQLAARLLAQQAAAQKAAQPRTALDPVTGKPVLIPAASQVAQPLTDAEYEALAPGTPYVIPAGEHAGQIVTKGAE